MQYKALKKKYSAQTIRQKNFYIFFHACTFNFTSKTDHFVFCPRQTENKSIMGKVPVISCYISFSPRSDYGKGNHRPWAEPYSRLLGITSSRHTSSTTMKSILEPIRLAASVTMARAMIFLAMTSPQMLRCPLRAPHGIWRTFQMPIESNRQIIRCI